MDKLTQSKEDFFRAFEEGDIYQEYLRTKAVVDARPELRREINQLRSKNFYFHQNGGLANYEEELEALAQEKERITSNEAVRDFLQAELDLCRFVQQLAMEFMERIDMEMEFI